MVEFNIPSKTATACFPVSAVNISPDPKSVSFDFGDIKLKSEGKQWIIQNDDPEAYNVPGEVPLIQIVESKNESGKLHVPGYSIVMIELDMDQ